MLFASYESCLGAYCESMKASTSDSYEFYPECLHLSCINAWALGCLLRILIWDLDNMIDIQSASQALKARLHAGLQWAHFKVVHQ